MSRGVLRLSPYASDATPGPLVQAICLPGYPHPIISQSDAKAAVACGAEDKDFDTSLTDETVKEILEDVVEEEEHKPENENPESKTKSEQPASETPNNG